ncbi:MAG: amino acid transporter [Bryobacterales bacterium]|nr:amino acid transporter [Bryobacterales bacterium]
MSTKTLESADSANRAGAAKIVVATTVALSFISFWRAASIVLSDLASSAFYAGGIAEHSIGRSAPWFILAVMLFSFAVRSIYMESSSMYVRGGVYIVVRDAMGPFAARLSVSTLLFDYVLTGPISVVVAGQYVAGLINEISPMVHSSFRIPADAFSATFAVMVTIYFWWQNVKGIHESSGKALRIMQITTVMVVAFLIWCPLTLLIRGGPAQIPPSPVPHNLNFSNDALGWFRGTIFPSIPLIALTVAFGHSMLSLSGFETLAQIYREVAYPKLKNLKITANLVCIYALVCTGVITLFAGMIIPDNVRGTFQDNLLGGLAMWLAGPPILRLAFHVFVVFVGALILSGAVNTAMIGANGVMNRVAEDGVLLDWFRKPHQRFGTTYRIVNLIALLQISAIVLSKGNTYTLGEAYAFGVVWSFALKALGVLVLRFTRHDQEYKTPLNFHVRGREWPVGLILTTLVLFTVAVSIVFTKKIATIYGVGFATVLFVLFTVSERVNSRKRKDQKCDLEKFNLDMRPEVAIESLHARPGCVLVAVRDNSTMGHLDSVLQKTNIRRHDIVVMTVRPVSTGAGEYKLGENQLFTDYEQELFSKVVTRAEKEGKTVDLVVVPGYDPFDAMVQTASKLKVSRLVTGVSLRMDSAELASRIGLAWEKLPEPRHPFSLEVISPGRPSFYVNLGPHPPRLWPEDLERLHDLWLDLTSHEFGSKLHHRDVVGVALRRLERDLETERRTEAVTDLNNELRKD